MHVISFLAPLLFAATSLAQAVEEGIAPSSPPPPGCESTANVNFTIGTLKFGHSLTKRESAVEAADSALVCTLKDGILRDRDSRTGSVVANRQFQFDGPPQAGAIYTGGFSICANGSLAIGGTTRWWQCSSGGFYNLYDEWIGAQCEEIRIQVTFPKTSSTSSVGATPTKSGLASSGLASVVSSLATISGEVSTVSKSAVGPSASFSSTPAASSASATRSGNSTSQPASSVAAASASSTPTGAADAPPAGGAAPTSFGVAKGSMLCAFVVIFGAALIL